MVLPERTPSSCGSWGRRRRGLRPPAAAVS